MTFPTINIIHLPERADREELYMMEFARQGIIDYKIWPGIRNVHATFAGISAAHKQVVSHAKRSGLKEILIGEDDLKFTSPNAFKYFVENKPEDYDMYLASIYTGWINQEDNTVKDFSGMTLYFIHERFYDKFLGVPLMNHIDRALANLGRYFVCEPFSCIQYCTFSDQKLAIVNHAHLLKGRKLYNDGK